MGSKMLASKEFQGSQAADIRPPRAKRPVPMRRAYERPPWAPTSSEVGRTDNRADEAPSDRTHADRAEHIPRAAGVLLTELVASQHAEPATVAVTPV